LSENNQIKEILTKYKVVAIVGLSNTLGKPSHRVGAYLKQHGFSILPVNPNIEEALCEKSYKSLLDIPAEIQKTIEIVDVFRKPEDVPPIIDQIIKLRALYGKPFVVWMQREIVNQEAAEAARKAGLIVVMDKCMMAEYMHMV
jgi:predicted CoA-binding protein